MSLSSLFGEVADTAHRLLKLFFACHCPDRAEKFWQGVLFKVVISVHRYTIKVNETLRLGTGSFGS